MAGPVKAATGLTGMAVANNPHRRLAAVYQKILKTINDMPEDYTYKKSTQAVIAERLKIVNGEPNIVKLEEKINCGQAEELIIQGENELALARAMLQWRPWEPLLEEAPAGQWKWPPV